VLKLDDQKELPVLNESRNRVNRQQFILNKDLIGKLVDFTGKITGSWIIRCPSKVKTSKTRIDMKSPKIIAEIGCNHKGDLSVAKE
jgi:hypothetical protein